MAYQVLRPFWASPQGRKPALLLVIVLAMIFAIVRIQVELNDWNNDFFNALSKTFDSAMKSDAQSSSALTESAKNSLWHLVMIFPVILVSYVFISVNKSWLIKLITIRWREWLTEYYVSRWLSDKRFYFSQLDGSEFTTDNPDQRIAEDVNMFIQKTLSLTLGFIQSFSTLITFMVILWKTAGPLQFTLYGREFVLHGYMVYAVLLIVIVGTLLAHRIGQPIRRLNIERQRQEANFRSHLIHNKVCAEQISMAHAESFQKEKLKYDFFNIRQNWLQLMSRQRKLDYWQNIYSQSLSVLPYFLLLPQYISGQLNIGGLMKARQAFMLVSRNLSWFIYRYDDLAELAAVIDRLHQFHIMTEPSAVPSPVISGADTVDMKNAVIFAPDGKVLLDQVNLSVNSGEWVQIRGESGVGKTTLLRTLSGSWPYASGEIKAPAGVFYVARTLDTETCSFREMICFNHTPDVAESELIHVIEQAGLSHYLPLLDDIDNWNNRLSSGEKQRVNIARILLQRPQWLFLDEATSHLDEDEALFFLQKIKQLLPFTGALLVSHQKNTWHVADKTLYL